MKAYTYSEAEAQISTWGHGVLRFADVEQVRDPQVADVFLVPGSLNNLTKAKYDIRKLPYFSDYESRHVFFDVSDDEETYSSQAIFLRCNLRPWMKAKDPNSISWHWPVEDFAHCMEIPSEGFTFDVSFHGWIHHESRRVSAESCARTEGLKADIRCYNNFYGYLSRDEQLLRRKYYEESIRQSRLMLCAEQIPGVFPYRFFEAMSAARIPVLVGSEFLFPLDEEIPYHEFTLQIDRKDAASTGRIIRDFLRLTTEFDLDAMSSKARLYWEKWLNRDDWPRTWQYAVDKALKQ